MASKTPVLFEVSPETLERLKMRCKTLRIDVGAIGDDLVEVWLKQNLETLEMDSGSLLAGMRRGLMVQQYLESIPHEACIKDAASRIQWANGLFLRMTGKSLDDLFNKPPGEIWTRPEDQDFVQEVLTWDQEVLSTRRPLSKVSKVRHGGQMRHRLTVRFPLLFAKNGEVLLIGTLGIDFATESDALAAHSAVRLNADWVALY